MRVPPSHYRLLPQWGSQIGSGTGEVAALGCRGCNARGSGNGCHKAMNELHSGMTQPLVVRVRNEQHNLSTVMCETPRRGVVSGSLGGQWPSQVHPILLPWWGACNDQGTSEGMMVVHAKLVVAPLARVEGVRNSTVGSHATPAGQGACAGHGAVVRFCSRCCGKPVYQAIFVWSCHFHVISAAEDEVRIFQTTPPRRVNFSRRRAPMRLGEHVWSLGLRVRL